MIRTVRERTIRRPADQVVGAAPVVWDCVFYGGVAVTALVTLITGADPSARHHHVPHSELRTLVMLVGLTVCYVLFGRFAVRIESTVLGAGFIVLLAGTITGVGLLGESAAIVLATAAFPLSWAMVPSRTPGIIGSALITVGAGAGFFHVSGVSLHSAREIGPWLLLMFVASALLGSWIDLVVRESRQRGRLIAELESAREALAAANHDAGRLAERERIAREIHDTIAQSLASIVMLSQSVPRAETLAAIEQTARESLTETRALLASSTPPELTDSTLAQALQRTADRFLDVGIPRIDLDLDEPATGLDELPATHQVALLRATREALTNIHKHADATQVSIAAHIVGDVAMLEITDDGIGFDPHAVTAGYGIAGMRNRTDELGGTFTLDSSPGKGTRLVIRFDVPATTLSLIHPADRSIPARRTDAS